MVVAATAFVYFVIVSRSASGRLGLRILSCYISQPQSSQDSTSSSSSVKISCYIPPAASLDPASQGFYFYSFLCKALLLYTASCLLATCPLRASTSIASSVKLPCYIPPAASWALSFPASTSIASSVKLSCYIPPAASWRHGFSGPLLL